MKKRTVPVDPFAICDMARNFELTANEAWVLHIVALQAEYRSKEWTGTYTDIAAATRLGRNTVPKVVNVLIAKGRFEIVQPFRQGADGRVRVVDRHLLVPVPRRSSNASIDANRDASDREGYASHSRPIRAGVADSDANDQEIAGVREVKRQGGEEVEVESPLCMQCGEPVQGHPFSHEPFSIEQPGNETWVVRKPVVPS